MVLALYGAGAMGREIKMIADESGDFDQIVFIDDIKTGELLGCPIYSFQEFKKRFSPGSAMFVTAFGEPRFRKDIFLKMKQAGYKGAVIRHPSAWVSFDAGIGEGVVFCQGAFVGSEAKIGDNFHGAVNSMIGHDTVIGDHVRVGAGAFIGGHVMVGNGAFIGSGASLKDRIKVGNDCVVAMGCALYTDMPDEATAMGNPARIVNDDRSSMLYAPSGTELSMAKEKEAASEDTIAEKYWEVFSGVFAGIDFNPVSFRFHDEGWESVSHMSLISSIEENFGITLKGREVLKINSYRAGLDMVKKKLEEKKG